jgi:hypothetical protein
MEKNIYNKMVKRTVIYTFSLWFVLFILGASGLYYTYGEFSLIQEEKIALNDTLKKLDDISKIWMSLWEFKLSGMPLVNDDENLRNILAQVEKDFYESHFTNESSSSYSDFIDKKIKDIEEKEDSEEQKTMEQISSAVLPTYVDDKLSSVDGEDFSELSFVNYIERIMQTFNLEYTWDIWLSDLLPLDVDDEKNLSNQKWEDEKEVLLENKIFYIPVSLTLVWSKASIIDFIYFVQNSWKVSAENTTLSVFQDSYFEKSEENFRSSNLIMEWETNSKYYNIYENQLIDFESISFKEYIYEERDWDKRWEFLANIRKLPQGLEKFEVDVQLRFYVKGISDYKIEKKYTEEVQWLLVYKQDIQKSKDALSAMKISEKTPEAVVVLKRLVGYEQYISWLEKKLSEFKNLKSGEIYDDILTIIDVKVKLDYDLQKVSQITKLKFDALEEDLEESLEEVWREE